MSNIYIQEPPTSGKVLLKTSVGDIDIELWCREAPKACRNFIQLCMEGYYNQTIFHRLVKGFIVQGGDPNGDGSGGESIYGEPFKDEFHSRLRFSRRGLVAMANAGKDDNGSQFFFTLGEANELQGKHTIFGKVTGDTVFNMLKLEDGLTDHNEKPLYPHKILKTVILLSPYDNIVPRKIERIETKEKKTKLEKGVKNFGLLSFGAEAEVDEEESNIFVQKNAGKAKSTHDVLDDQQLSKETATFVKLEEEETIDPIEFETTVSTNDLRDKVRDKLKLARTNTQHSSKIELNMKEKQAEIVHASDSDSDDFMNELEKERQFKKKQKMDDIKEQILSLKKDYKKDKKNKDELIEVQRKVEEEKQTSNELMQQYVSEQQKYSHLKKDLPQKGALREQYTLALLSKFKNKLENIREKRLMDEETGNSSSQNLNNSSDDDDINGDEWLAHTLRFEEQGSILAKDASTKEDDWYDVYDPRNPLNKRKRGDIGKHSKKVKEN